MAEMLLQELNIDNFVSLNIDVRKKKLVTYSSRKQYIGGGTAIFINNNIILRKILNIPV